MSRWSGSPRGLDATALCAILKGGKSRRYNETGRLEGMSGLRQRPIPDAKRMVWQLPSHCKSAVCGYVSATIRAVDPSGGVLMDFSRHRLSDPYPWCPVVPDIVRNWATENPGLDPSTLRPVALPQAFVPLSNTMFPLARREPPRRLGSCVATSPHQEVVAQV